MFEAPESICIIDTTHAGSMAILAPRGELDLAAFDALLERVDWLLKRDPLVLAIDLRGLTFIDARGLQALIAAGQRCEARGRRFTVIRGNAMVDRLLQTCRMDAYFDIVTDLDQLPSGKLTEAAGL
jgi:anti-sigma B factor antagonist